MTFSFSKKIAPIIYWKDPDILISLVKDDVEHPLVLLEFSTAVFTEDHELQRFDGMLTATTSATESETWPRTITSSSRASFRSTTRVLG